MLFGNIILAAPFLVAILGLPFAIWSRRSNESPKHLHGPLKEVVW